MRLMRSYPALYIDASALALLAAAVFLLAGLPWALLAAGVALLVLNWRYGPQ